MSEYMHSSDHPSRTLLQSGPEMLFDDVFIETGEITVPNLEQDTETPSRARRISTAGKHMARGAVTLSRRAEKTPSTTVPLGPRELLENLKTPHPVTGNIFIAETPDRDIPYDELGGRRIDRNAEMPENHLSRPELEASLETYQDWYEEFDRLTETGAFEAGKRYKTMEAAEQHRYFTQLMRELDRATNRINLIGSESRPSAHPAVAGLYKNRGDAELKEYAHNLASLRTCVYETEVAQAAFRHFSIPLNDFGEPLMTGGKREEIRRAQVKLNGNAYATKVEFSGERMHAKRVRRQNKK